MNKPAPDFKDSASSMEQPMSYFDLAGKVALITGSSRGIGLAIAEQFASQGAKVVISSRKAAACEVVADTINRRHGAGTAIAVAASISSKSDLTHLVETVVTTLGPIDVLVCNAASNPYYGPMEGITDDQFRKVFENNVLASHWLVQLVAPRMRARREGSIILISSVGGMRGSASIGAYNVSKAADFQLARNLAVEFGPFNVRVNCIAPGLIKTDFARALWENPPMLERITSTTPMQRMGATEEVASVAVFLASRASSFVTGHTLVVDGGATIRGQDVGLEHA